MKNRPMRKMLQNTLYRPFILLLFFLAGSAAHVNSFADNLYTVQTGDFLGKIVAKNYPSRQRITSQQQIMVAILRANPTAFRGGNVHFLKKVDQLLLPAESSIALIPKDEAVKTIKEHLTFFKQKKTGDFPHIPLQTPVVKSKKKVIDPNKQEATNKKETVDTLNTKPSVTEASASAKDPEQKATEPNKQEAVDKKETADTLNTKPSVTEASASAKDPEQKATEPNKQEAVDKKETADTLNTKPSVTEASASAKDPEQKATEPNKQEAINKKETADTLNTKPSVTEASSSERAEELVLKNNPKTTERLTTADKNDFHQIETTIKKEITIYNWNNFLPDDVLKSFTQTTGIKVNYFTYTKEEVMYEKIKALNRRGYDLLIASTKLVQKMRDNGLLQAIDHRKLKHFDYLNPKLLNKSYDPNNEFSIPYLWGSVGVGVNGLKGINITRWKDLWHKQWQNRLVLRDDMRNLFAVALKVNGHSINSKNPDEIKQAYKRLREIIPNIKKLSNFAEFSDHFTSTKPSISIIKSSRVLKLKQKHPNIQHLYPKEGAIFLMESFVIPSNASNLENSYAFINYLLRPEIAARCAKELNEATPNLKALTLLDNHTGQNIIIPPDTETLKKADFKEDIGKTKEIYQLYWRKFKQEVKMR